MTTDETREDRRQKCIHLFGGECTRNCTSPEQFRPCDGQCPRMRSYGRRPGIKDNKGFKILEGSLTYWSHCSRKVRKILQAWHFNLFLTVVPP